MCFDAIAKYFKKLPHELENYYCDDFDYYGLGYWYNKAVEISKSMEV